ncbi:MAG: hypothetical protein ABW224_21955 [Kibdelosporangium sp.]
MARWGLIAMVVPVVVATAGCGGGESGIPLGGQPTTTTSKSRLPFNGKTVAAGDVQKVNDLGGAKMQTLAGAEIRGYRTSLKILEFGTAEQIDADGGYRGVDGTVLIAFRVSVQVAKGDGDIKGQVTANVSVDGTQRTLNELVGSVVEGASPKTYSYVVAVPEQDRRSVDLELKSVGTVQSFDLLEGRPKGDRPKALYRPADGTQLIQQSLTPATFEVAPKGTFDSTHTVTVSDMYFSYFHPDTGTAPSSPDKAWLVFHGTGKTKSPGYYTCVPTPDSHRLIDDKQVTYQAAPSSKLPSQTSIVGDTDFKAVYEVPSDIAKATFTVAASKAVCQISTGTYATVDARGEAKIEVTVPEK